MLPPHSLANTMSNSELFAWLRQGAVGHEYLRRCLVLTRPEFEERRAPGLSVNVSPLVADPKSYLITIANIGPHLYRDVRARYEPLLLNAESFSLDTTHMPSELAQKSGDPIQIDVIPAGRSIQMVRAGYDVHDRYDGRRETTMDLEFHLEGCPFTKEDRRWIPAFVNVPKAKRD